MKEITKKEFTGIFKEEFENFLRYKNALGYYKKIEGKPSLRLSGIKPVP
ncbi:MAG: hypothetical protein ACLTML_22875 [Blautia faecis]